MNFRRVGKKFFSSGEELISMILGLVIVVVIIGLVINFFNTRRNGNVNVPGVSNTEDEQKEDNNLNNENVYKVVKGDSLWKIALNKYNDGYKWVEIAKENNMNNPGLLVEGQELKLPNLDQNKADANIEKEEYVVVAGDNLWNLAEKKYNDGFKWVEIAKENKLDNPRILTVGQKIILPKTAKTEVTSSNTITEGSDYVVVKNDNLWSIAVRTYGDGFKWMEVWKENKNVISDPNELIEGTKLKLPKLSE